MHCNVRLPIAVFGRIRPKSSGCDAKSSGCEIAQGAGIVENGVDSVLADFSDQIYIW